MKNNSTNVVIIGYYNHYNTGDEQYKNTFKKLIYNVLGLSHYSLKFIDCDTLKNPKLHTFNDDDIIIVGGGDILNDYFLNNIINTFNGKNNKIYGISVGIPYLDILTSNKLKIFDKIYLRTRQDIEKLQKMCPTVDIQYIPDISYLITNTQGTQDIELNNNHYIHLKNNIKKKIVCLSLSRHIFNKQYQTQYNSIIVQFSIFIKYLITSNYHVVFVPFNTNNNNSSENDIIIHNDIMNELKQSHEYVQENITNIQMKLSEEEIIDIYKLCYFVIPMRFHACLFSIYAQKPFLPVYTSRKITNLLLDISWNYGYKLSVNAKDIPMDLNLELLILRFKSCIEEYTECTNNITQIYNMLENDSQFYNTINIIDNKHHKNIFINKNTNVDKINLIKEKINEYLLSINSPVTIDSLYKLTDIHIKEIIVQIVSFYITEGNPNSIYNYGLHEKMFKEGYDFNKEWTWVIEHFVPIKLTNTPYGLFNLNFIDQIDYAGVHRAGWQYVYDSLANYHNESSDLYLDLYLDRTFHWNYEINKIINVVPYKKPWCGFIHHTFDTEFSDYNNFELLENKDFLESLKCCKALFVLSDYLSEQLRSELYKLGISIPVYSFVHPTETKVPLFTLEAFAENNDKGIVNIGGWLRNIYNFYKLEVSNTIDIKSNRGKPLQFLYNKYDTHSFKKYIVKGKNMNNYFPHEKFLSNLYEMLLKHRNDDSSHPQGNCCTNENIKNKKVQIIYNNWDKHLYKDFVHMFNSVNIIEYIDNDEYDKLLTNNIVFLNLVDASAVNTLIECIVRNTPIVINKIPAVVELLGEKYPLYYDNISDVKNMITYDKIQKAYKYIKALNKKKLDIKYFINDFITIIKNIHYYI